MSFKKSICVFLSYSIPPRVCISGMILFTLIISQLSCSKKNYSYDSRQNYVESVDSSGFVLSGIYQYDDGFHTNASAKYRIKENKNRYMNYDLLTAEYWHLRIYDTISFYFNFNYPDSSKYIFYDSEYNHTLEKYEVSVAEIPLRSKGKLDNIEDCTGCNIYKFESMHQNQCYTWYASDSIGFLKRYAPYNNDMADYEIGFLRGTPKYNYSQRLLKAIKADRNFHTRCSPGTLW